jgi:hypothetical protein
MENHVKLERKQGGSAQSSRILLQMVYAKLIGLGLVLGLG